MTNYWQTTNIICIRPLHEFIKYSLEHPSSVICVFGTQIMSTKNNWTPTEYSMRLPSVHKYLPSKKL